MCGILGLYALKEENIDLKYFQKLLAITNFRGPDSNGVYHDKNFIFGINRLSIVDKPNGNQPISTEDGRYTIIFNGEIYNYQQIKNILIEKKIKFKTNTDTEVVLMAYIVWGKQCLEKFNGMFAFCIYDKFKKNFFLARDKIGKKPLYYSFQNNIFIFSSEISQIIQSRYFKSKINFEAISDLFSQWYISEPKSIIKNVQQLTPGSYLFFENNNFKKEKWNNLLLDNKYDGKHSENEFDTLMNDAVKIRLDEDTKFAVLLSGGIDSGIISYYAKKNYNNLKAFTINFEEKSYSETSLAKNTAQKLDINLDVINIEYTKELITKILEDIDEPLGNASYIPSYIIFNKIKTEGCKIVLTGDGGDELFGGYPTYQAEYYRKFINFFPKPIFNILKYLINSIPVSYDKISFDYKLKQLINNVTSNPSLSHSKWREILSIENQVLGFNKFIVDEIFNYNPLENYKYAFKESAHLDFANSCMYADFNTYLLNDHLRKIDRSSMHNSVEARSPFLDYRIIDFAFKMKSNKKFNLFNTKIFLKNFAKKILPRKVISSKKSGLTPPINYLIFNYFNEFLQSSVNDKSSFCRFLFKETYLKLILTSHFSRKIDYSRFIWTLISLECWYLKNKKFVQLY